MQKLGRVVSLAIVAFWVLLRATPSVSQQQSPTPVEQTGSWLYHSCIADIKLLDSSTEVSGDDFRHAQSCVYYVKGLVDGAAITSKTFCADDASIATIIRVYVDYMQRHPKSMDDYRALGLLSALMENYPCPKKKQGK